MAAHKQKHNQKHDLKHKFLAYAIGIAALAPLLPFSFSHAQNTSKPVVSDIASTTESSKVAIVLTRSDLPILEKTQETVIIHIEAPIEKVEAKQETEPVVTNTDNAVWDNLAQCESGGNWQINTGNGYYGGIQFSQDSWNAVGGQGLPSEASREEQIMRGKMLQERGGWGHWPACSAKLGLL